MSQGSRRTCLGVQFWCEVCVCVRANLLHPLDPDAVVADVEVIQDVRRLVLPEDSVDVQQALQDAGLPWRRDTPGEGCYFCTVLGLTAHLAAIVPYIKATGSEGERQCCRESWSIRFRLAARMKDKSIFSLQRLRFYDQSKIAQNFSASPFKSVVRKAANASSLQLCRHFQHWGGNRPRLKVWITSTVIRVTTSTTKAGGVCGKPLKKLPTPARHRDADAALVSVL